MKWISLIPMRAGSKGLPNKNTIPVAGKPLYQYSVDAALSAGARRIYISTDIQKVLAKTMPKRVQVVKRQTSLCTDDTHINSVVFDFLKFGIGSKIRDEEIVVLMQPTSPIRAVKDLQNAVKKFSETNNTDLLMSVTQTDSTLLKSGLVQDGYFKPISSPQYCFENRQSLPKVCKPSGSFYVFRAGWFRTNKSFVTNSILSFEIPAERSIDIDTKKDIRKAELILKRN